MDLKEIIKWFIPCFHILLLKKVKMCGRLTYICLFLLFILRPSYGADTNSNSLVSEDGDIKNIVDLSYLDFKNNQSVYNSNKMERNTERSLDTSVGRTFGRPFMKKMMAGLLPIIFQMGAMSTWAVVAALIGVKTLIVTMVILKLLLLAGAAKVGAFFAHHKGHGSNHGGWEPPPQKEIHLHIHNGGHPEIHDEHGTILSEWKQVTTPPTEFKPMAPVVPMAPVAPIAPVAPVANGGYYFGPPPYRAPDGFKPMGFFIGPAPTEGTRRILNIKL